MLKQEVSYEQLLSRVQELEESIELLNMEKSDLELLLETTTEHATEIENELQEKNEQVERFFLALQKELQTGRKIQADFLPQELPILSGWELAASFAPAREVAGDFYDAFLLPDNQLGLVIADVCDKGVGAALFMSLTRSLIRVLAYQARERLQHLSSKGASYMVELPPVKGQVEMLLPAIRGAKCGAFHQRLYCDQPRPDQHVRHLVFRGAGRSEKHPLLYQRRP